MLVTIFSTVYLFSKQDAYTAAWLLTPPVWIVWAAIKKSPASIVTAMVLIALATLLTSLIINADSVNISQTLTGFVILPLIAAGMGSFLAALSVSLMAFIVFKDVFNYRKYRSSDSAKPVLSSEFKSASEATVLLEADVWLGTNLVNGKKGKLKLYKNKLMFIKNGEQAEFEHKFSDIRGVVISPSEILINMNNGKKYSATFFNRTNLILFALISFAAMALLSLMIGFISIFVVYGFIFYGIKTRYKYQTETKEWKRALHNVVDIEKISGYPMGISFRKFILLLVLALIAAFCLAILITGSY